MTNIEIINSLEKKFEKINDKIKVLLDNSQEQQKLLATIDFINALGISLEEYDLLTSFGNIVNLEEEHIKRLIDLNDRLDKKLKYIDIINEKIILTCTNFKVVNKNTIGFILQKRKTEKEDEKQNVIINVYVEDNKPPLLLEDLTKNDNI